MPRNLKRGERRNLKPSVFRPKSSEEQKRKGQHVRRCPIFRPKSSEEQKKVFTPSDCPLYVYHLYTTKALCICLRGRVPASPPGYAPDDASVAEFEPHLFSLSVIFKTPLPTTFLVNIFFGGGRRILVAICQKVRFLSGTEVVGLSCLTIRLH